MPFPEHISQVLDHFQIRADTKAALYDLYVSMGEDVLEAFADIAEGITAASTLTPEDTLAIRSVVVERYLRRNHPRWVAGEPTASLWRPAGLEGRVSGVAVPLGGFPEGAARVVGEGQSLPDGFLMMGRNAHSGGRHETVSFDVVAHELEDAVEIARAAGQQHTLPGSVGETSGTFDAIHRLALIWEVQPNVFKPDGERNRAIAKIYRRHRNWHLATLGAAIGWLRGQQCRIFVLRGHALAIAHEVNPDKPVSAMIASLHDRTAQAVTEAMGLVLAEPSRDDEQLLIESIVMNHALRQHAERFGPASVMWRIG